MMQEDYVGNDYYGSNYDNLEIAHREKVTASSGNSRYEPGNTVIVSARAEDGNIYGFLGIAEGVLSDTAEKFWGGYGEGRPVNELQVITPITLIPAELYHEPNLSGFQLVDREQIVEHLMSKSAVTA